MATRLTQIERSTLTTPPSVNHTRATQLERSILATVPRRKGPAIITAPVGRLRRLK